jgi:hypothetical protein
VTAHGTLTRYKSGPGQDDTPGKGCRCGPCREANTGHSNRRDRMIAYGRWQPFVPADRARAHVRALQAQGVGWMQAARLAGLSDGCVSALLYGRGDRPPTRRIRQDTEKAILGVRPVLTQLAGSTLVDPAGTRRRIQALVWNGWSLVKLTDRLGVGDVGAVIRRSQVEAATARAVRRLYDELWDQPPPEVTRGDRVAAGRSRSFARKQGWAPVGAWDEDRGSPHFIDDPEAKPARGWLHQEAA